MSRQYKFTVKRTIRGTVIVDSNIPKKYLLLAVHSVHDLIDTPWFVSNRTKVPLGQCIHLGGNTVLGSEYCYGHHVVEDFLSMVAYFQQTLDMSRYISVFVVVVDRGEVPVLIIQAIDKMTRIEIDDDF